MVLEQTSVHEPEDILIPDADDLVIEILTDQMIDLDESAANVLEIFAVTGGDKKRVKVMERKMTDGDKKLMVAERRSDRDAVAAGAQSVRRRAQERVADKDRVIRGSRGV